MRVLSQRGVAGFKLVRYRVRANGDNSVRERWNDTYPPTTQIVRVGTGDVSKDDVKAADDAHPEYVADELLVLTEGPDVPESKDHPGDRMLEDRDAGRFGEYGWMEKAHMPVWKSKTEGADERARDRTGRPKNRSAG
jgi:hypothetical protein